MEFLYIRNIGYNIAESDRIFVDIWILTEGLSSDKIGALRQIVKLTQDNPVCCFEYVDGGQFYVKQLLTGFARIIIHKKYTGI